MLKEADLLLFTESLITCKGNGAPKTGANMQDVGLIKNAGIAVKHDIIIDVADRKTIESQYKLSPAGRKIDAHWRPVLPGLIDSHTHPVYAGNRVKEFTMRAQGATYQEIHAAGGGIQFTVENTRKATDRELYSKGAVTLMRMLEHGTTTVEAKSGYGLETEEELRELKVIRQLSEALPLTVVSTFLGAHSIPPEYKDNREEFVRIIIEEMMPRVKEEKLAKFVDVFCEEGAFTLEETRRILQAAKDMGLDLKLHAEEFSSMGSAKMAGEMGAISVDHLLKISERDIEALAKTDTILTIMPGTLFFLNMKEYAPARKMLDMGAKIALATDFNAGSCMSESMLMAMSLACIAMKMTPEEAINAATYNASFAVGLNDRIGSIEAGKKADMVIFEIDDYRLIPYHFGVNLVKTVFRNGRAVLER